MTDFLFSGQIPFPVSLTFCLIGATRAWSFVETVHFPHFPTPPQPPTLPTLRSLDYLITYFFIIIIYFQISYYLYQTFGQSSWVISVLGGMCFFSPSISFYFINIHANNTGFGFLSFFCNSFCHASLLICLLFIFGWVCVVAYFVYCCLFRFLSINHSICWIQYVGEIFFNIMLLIFYRKCGGNWFYFVCSWCLLFWLHAPHLPPLPEEKHPKEVFSLPILPYFCPSSPLPPPPPIRSSSTTRGEAPKELFLFST